jgi:hypothetical protein
VTFHRYWPRRDCGDHPLDSDDHWLTLDAVAQVVAERLREREHVTVGFAEVPLGVSRRNVEDHLLALEHDLIWTGRRAATEDGTVVYHWPVAEYITALIEAAFWGRCLRLKLGEWVLADQDTVE